MFLYSVDRTYLYIKTEHRRVSIALYLPRLLLCMTNLVVYLPGAHNSLQSCIYSLLEILLEDLATISSTLAAISKIKFLCKCSYDFKNFSVNFYSSLFGMVL